MVEGAARQSSTVQRRTGCRRAMSEVKTSDRLIELARSHDVATSNGFPGRSNRLNELVSKS